MTFGDLIAGMSSAQRVRDAEDRVSRARAKVRLLSGSHQAPHDPAMMAKAKAAVVAAERHLSRCRLAAAEAAR